MAQRAVLSIRTTELRSLVMDWYRNKVEYPSDFVGASLREARFATTGLWDAYR